MKYKVKNFSNEYAETLQYELESWIESRDHISIVSVNIWSNSGNNFATIAYRENIYEL